MERKRLKCKVLNGMYIEVEFSSITGVHTDLSNKQFLALELHDGLIFPIHPDDRRAVIKTLNE